LARELEHDPHLLMALARQLVARDAPWDRFIAYELLNGDERVIRGLGDGDVRRLGRGIDSWPDVDMFAVSLLDRPGARDG